MSAVPFLARAKLAWKPSTPRSASRTASLSALQARPAIAPAQARCNSSSSGAFRGQANHGRTIPPPPPPSGGPGRTPGDRRGMSTMTSMALALLIPSSFYIIGSLYPPETLLLLLPRAAPPPPARDSEEGRLQTEQLEQELQALDVVRRERERVAASNGEMYEYRPFLEPMHPHSLTSSILRGPNMLALPPIVFADHDETEATVIVHLGRSLCGHDGIVHGGLLATMFDETMARNALMNIPSKIGVTATLDVAYRKPVKAGNFVVIRTKLDEVKGRKLRVSASMEDLEGEVMCTAKALFVEPKYAKYMKSPFKDDKPQRVIKPLRSAPTDGLPPPPREGASGKYVASSPNENEGGSRAREGEHATGPPRSSFPAMFGDMHNQNGDVRQSQKASSSSQTASSDAPSSSAQTANKSTTSPLPPGIVLGPDGKPCKVCSIGSSFKRLAKQQRLQQEGGGGGSEGGQRRELHSSAAGASSRDEGSSNKPRSGIRGEGAAAAAAAAAVAVTGASLVDDDGNEDDHSDHSLRCPLDVESLGRATWSYLHTMAAYYPSSPSSADRELMRAHIAGLARFYPCSHCAADFAERLKEHPVDVSGAEGLSRWMCDRHNEVNERLGKDRFDCERVMERWRDGWKDGRCE